ncbi:hypothetical protein DM02DRAFT_610524 [Periconia macrospinosa]|uniref:BZIP domain-containing protein n=1 Tax=Periconia macrospinosa TaxID=97972 RepID=A0A2V1E4K6_9PLEO|nr:hypothetical protein DM02DRAFT_610524 [Periconia macrospinosa]
MDSQSFDYWMGQNNAYIPPPPQSHQSALYELPPDLSKVPSLSGSPVSSTYDQFPSQMPQEYFPGPQVPNEPMHFGGYQIPMTPPEFGSDHDTPSYCSPPPLPQQLDQVYGQVAQSGADRQHTTSGRRRAQNRAAQRAFRERKEKHARDLEVQLSALTERYTKLETSHSELNAAYEKLRKTIELLTQDDDAEGEEDDGKLTRRRSSNTDTLRKLLDILHGEYKSVAVKTESA